MSALGLDFTLAARYLRGRKLRTFLTTLAVVFGVMLIFGLNGLLPGIIQSFRQSLVAVTGKVDLTVQSASGGSFSPAIAGKIARVDGVAAVSPTLRKNLALPPKQTTVPAVTVVGVNPTQAQNVRQFPVKEGRFIKQTDGLGVAMSADLGRQFKVSVGDTLSLPTAQGLRSFKVVGLLNLPIIPGSEEVFMPLGTAQNLFNERGDVNAIDVAFSPQADPAAVRRAVKRAVGSDFSIGGEESGSQLLASVQLGQAIMNIFGVFALVMGGFIILNTFRTVVAERRRDIGMLRAVGASRRTILGMFFAESLIQGILGTALGLAAGWALAVGAIAAITPIYQQFLHFPISIKPAFGVGLWVVSILLGVGVTVLGALMPAFSAARITPLEALRPQLGEVYERVVGRRAWLGAALIVLAVLGLISQNSSLIGLSVVLFMTGVVLVAPAIVKPISNVFSRLISLVFAREGDVARANLQRNPGRAAVTASAMMVSIAIVVAMLGMVTSISDGFLTYLNKSLGADFVVVPTNLVLSTGNVGAGPKLVSAIRDTKGVSDVATLRLALGSVNGTRVQFIGIDPRTYPKVASFEFAKGSSQADIGQLAHGRAALVNGVYASQYGLKVGGRVKVDTPNGPRNYRVVGIGSDYLNAKLSTAYISQENLRRDFNTTADLLVMANAAAGANRPQVRRELEHTLAGYPQFILYDGASFRTQQAQTLRQSLGSLYFLVVVLALPSLLALLNTLAIAVLARTREIGILRAVGSLRKQIRRMIMGESLLMSAIGTSFGILAGIWLGYVFTNALNVSGFSIPYYFPVSGILTAIAAGIIFAVLASLVPARRAARLNVVDALKWE